MPSDGGTCGLWDIFSAGRHLELIGANSKKHGHSRPEGAGRFVIDLLLQSDAEPKIADAFLEAGADGDESQRVRDIAHAVAISPEFQLA